MVILFFSVLILGHQLLLLSARRRFDPFDVKVLIDLVLLTMWVYAPLTNSGLRFRLENDTAFAATTFLGIIFLYIGLHLPLWKRKNSMPRLLSEVRILRMEWFWLAFFVFLVTTLVFLYQKTQFNLVNIVDLVTGARLSALATALNESNEGSILDRLLSFTQPILLLWLAITFSQSRWIQSMLIYFVLVLSIVLVATTRLPVILTLLLPVVYFVRNRTKSLSIPAAVGFGIVFVLLMYALNIVRTQGLDKLLTLDFSWQQAWDSITVNFSPMRGYEILWELERTAHVSYEYGLSYVYVLVTAVPRALWPGKPLTSMEARWTTELFGQHFAMTDEGWGVWTFTPWGEGLVQFGILGVFLNLFLYGLLVAWADNKFGRSILFSLVWFYFSVLAATYLRSSFSALAWTFLQAFIPLLIVFHLSTRPRRHTSKTKHRASAMPVFPQIITKQQHLPEVEQR